MLGLRCSSFSIVKLGGHKSILTGKQAGGFFGTRKVVEIQSETLTFLATFTFTRASQVAAQKAFVPGRHLFGLALCYLAPVF